MFTSGILIAISMPFKYYNNALPMENGVLTCALTTTAFLSRKTFELNYGGSALQRALAIQALVFWLTVDSRGRLIGFL